MLGRYPLLALALSVGCSPSSPSPPPSPSPAGGATERTAVAGPEPSEPIEHAADRHDRSGPPPSTSEAPGEPPPTAVAAPRARPCAERAWQHAVAEARRRESADPNAIEIGFESADGPDPECATQTLLPDLDGDGAQDLDIQPTCGPWNKVWPHFLYLSRGCRFAGLLFDAELERQRTATSGVRDLEATSSLGCAGLELTWNRYEWSGDTYARVATADCCFCEPPEECALATDPAPPVCRRLASRYAP